MPYIFLLNSGRKVTDYFYICDTELEYVHDMRRVILVLAACTVFQQVSAHQKDSLLVMFWNLENFFGWQSDAMKERHWTKSRFYTKCNSVAKSIFWIGDRFYDLPDVIGLAEIENKTVLRRLISSTLLRKYDYDIVHFDSGDRRGIDVALLYRKSSLELLSTSLKTPSYEGRRFSTRDMLHCRMKLHSTGDTLDFIVCHHPSKFGGEESSKGRRQAAMSGLRDMCDSLGDVSKIVMGDFNDVPSAKQFDELEGVLYNKSIGLYEQGKGTIRYKGKWEMIDMFLVDNMLDPLSEMRILYIPFLMTYDKKYPGEKPLRTYTGPRYTGGVSDHCPIILKLDF